MRGRFLNKELLCGRHALDLGPYYFFAPVTILLNPIVDGSFKSPVDSALWIFSGIIPFLLLLALVKLLQVVLIRKISFFPFPVWLILTIGAGLGLFKSLTSFEFERILQLHEGFEITIASRILSGVGAWIFIVPGFAMISNYMELTKARRLVVMERLVTAEALKSSNEAILEQTKLAARAAIEGEVTELLKVTLEEIDESKGKTLEKQYRIIAAVLTHAAENLIRPLSHELMSERRLDFPAPRIWQIFLSSINRPILPIIPILVATNISVATLAIREVVPFSTLLIMCLLQSALVWITVLFILKLTWRFNHFGQVALFTGILFIVVADRIGLILLGINGYRFSQDQRILLNFLWFFSIFLVVSFLAQLFRGENEVEFFVEQMINSKIIDQKLIADETLRVKHDIARYLHGNLQSRIMSLGLTLELNKNQDQASLDSALTLAQSLLQSPFAEYLELHDRTLNEEVEFNCGKWHGLLGIETEIEDIDSQLSFAQKRAIGAALEEALANALRHGYASTVKIRIFKADGGVSVQVLDDGVGPRAGGAGLGSKLYDSVASGGWTLQHRPDGNGTILEMRL
ncbi:unannotated protein [freshwater metagenome]|uniref:Unannotated protein n=1 Tax=freshwater metagenome TaxID=449393 RepID=A0A6J6GHN3_9ZZZZ